MGYLDLIKNRRSVRTFDGEPLSPKLQEKILTYAQLTDNPFGIPITWAILDAKTHGLSTSVIVGADTYLAGKMQRVPHAEEAFGYAMEKIVLYIHSLGLGTTWIAGTMDRPAFELAMELEPGEVMPCITPVGVPAAKMSIRESLMRKGVGADTRLPAEKLFFKENFDTPFHPQEAGKYSSILEMVRYSPSAVNKQPWRILFEPHGAHFYEKHSKGYVRDDGWDLQKIDMGIALCHFAAGIAEHGLHADFQIKDPGIPLPPDMTYIASYCLPEGGSEEFLKL